MQSEGLYVQAGLHAMLLLLALYRGAAPERILAGVLAARLPGHLWPTGLVWHGADAGQVLLDGALLAACVAVALRANRMYPLWIGGAQVIAVFAHLLRMALPGISRFAYETMVAVPAWIQLAALTLGLASHMSRRRILGSYRSWRECSNPAPAPAPNRPPGG